MNTYVEPVCPFEGCEAEAVHYHRNGRAADFCACPCGLCDPDHLDSNDFATRCYAHRPGNAKPETDPRHTHDPWILPTREQVARVLFASTWDDVDWDESTGVRHDFYLDDADAVLALLSPWRPVEPGTTIKAGTRYRVEEASGSYECTTRSDWTVANRSRRVYIDPRTVPAEPDPRVKAVAQVLAEKAGISLDEAEATLVVQALDRMGDDSVTYPTTTAHYMEDL